MNAARPPAFWALAITCSINVVLPEDSGPKISMTRPRGMPPTPSARSTDLDERGQAAGLLGAGDHVQHQRRLARGFGAKDLDDSAPRDAAHAQRKVHRQGAGRNDLDLSQGTGVAEAHDTAVAVGFGDGRNGGIEVALARRGQFGGFRCFRVGGGRFLNILFGGLGWHNRIRVVWNLTQIRESCWAILLN